MHSRTLCRLRQSFQRIPFTNRRTEYSFPDPVHYHKTEKFRGQEVSAPRNYSQEDLTKEEIASNFPNHLINLLLLPQKSPGGSDIRRQWIHFHR